MKNNAIQINGGTMNVHVSVKNVTYAKKVIFGILLHVVVKMENIMESIIDDSAITCYEIIDAEAEAKSNDEAKSNNEETKTFLLNFNEINITYETQNFYILLTFSLNIIAMLIVVSIYCYLIKYRAK